MKKKNQKISKIQSDLKLSEQRYRVLVEKS